MTLLSQFDRIDGHRQAVALMLASCAFLSIGDAVAKWLAATYPVGQIVFTRGSIILLMLLGLSGASAMTQLRPRRLWPQLRRAGFFVLATFLMIWSLKLLPLPTVSAISFAAPLMMTALAPSILGERVGPRRGAAVLVGFFGVLVIVNPFGGEWSWVVALPIAAALAAAIRDLLTRQIAAGESGPSIVFMAIAGTVIAGAATAGFGWVAPTPSDLALFVFLGAVHGAAYLMQVAAFRSAEAALLAPFKYSLLLWSIIVAFLVWGHFPNAAVLLGAGIVIASGVYIWRRELRVAA